MASFALSATTCEALKHAWTKNKKKVGKKNGQFRFVRHHGWHTQAGLDQKKKERKKKKKKVGENNGQLRFVRHHGCACKHAWTNIMDDVGNFIDIWLNITTSGKLPCVKICFPKYFGITRRNIYKKKKKI